MARCGASKVGLTPLAWPCSPALLFLALLARASGTSFVLRSLSTGCLNWKHIGMHKDARVETVEECGALCGGTDGCVGFGFQVQETCEKGGIEKGACMLWKGKCEDDGNKCYNDYTMIAEPTVAPARVALVVPDSAAESIKPPALAPNLNMSAPHCKYFIGESNKACPSGTMPLTPTECTEASERFGTAHYHPLVDADPRRPYGCFSKVDNKPFCKVCRLNEHCVYTSGYYGDASCPAGTLRLSEYECLKAQHRMGLPLDNPFKLSSKKYPRGCFMARSRFYYNAHISGDGRNGTAPVCKKCPYEDIMVIRRSEESEVSKHPGNELATRLQSVGGRLLQHAALAGVAAISLAGIAAGAWRTRIGSRLDRAHFRREDAFLLEEAMN